MNPIIKEWTPALVALALATGWIHAAEPKGLVRGAEFRNAWNSTVSARVDERSLVQIMDQFCGSRRIAWVIDRRLDPDHHITSDLPLSPLSELLPELLKTAQAGAVTIGQSIVVGPADKLIDLRTLAELQRQELQQTRLTAGRKQTLAQTIELHWEDLTEPRQLVEQVVKRAKIDLAGAELIPYDLWRGGDLVGVTAGEALSVLAWQYDLQLKWHPDGQASLVPVVQPVQVARTFSVSESRQEAIRAQFPALTWTDEGKSLRATGRVEDMEAVDQWLKGNSPANPKPKPKNAPKDWRDRTFTLRIKNAPLGDVLTALKKQGIPLEWNEDELVKAGINMKGKIELELNQATAEELLSTLCRPAKLKYEITESSARISAP
ncbi:MAG: hypothetical protein U0929_15755 [Planctomycetaceae bacterium]